ncbi:OsmC family protein [Phaeocystidibacter luteus]|uniref:OsmC family protein n=1 Tax=Phaeocystidibacter luteus TaxID=911197 RepID=A0A6N6RHG1_9FLAO|nr:OsmC family protein [Phaeocystidibacter luteus]KAB2813725.1 OsmC family protein [Phaeocystidibacter luteus]
METKEVIVDYTDGMSFDGHVDEYSITMDAKDDVGGRGLGPTPKPLLLVSLAGCTGMDVVSLLKKMRQEYDSFQIKVTAEQTDEHPKHYHKIHIDYIFEGSSLDKDKVQKAVDLSQDKYCGVSYMLGKVAKITYEITIQ